MLQKLSKESIGTAFFLFVVFGICGCEHKKENNNNYYGMRFHSSTFDGNQGLIVECFEKNKGNGNYNIEYLLFVNREDSDVSGKVLVCNSVYESELAIGGKIVTEGNHFLFKTSKGKLASPPHGRIYRYGDDHCFYVADANITRSELDDFLEKNGHDQSFDKFIDYLNAKETSKSVVVKKWNPEDEGR